MKQVAHQQDLEATFETCAAILVCGFLALAGSRSNADNTVGCKAGKNPWLKGHYLINSRIMWLQINFSGHRIVEHNQQS